MGDSPWLQRLLPPRQAPAFATLDVAGAPPALAGILPDHERVGSQAVEQLVSLMRANQRGSATTEACTYVPVRWRPGEAAPAAGLNEPGLRHQKSTTAAARQRGRAGHQELGDLLGGLVALNVPLH